MPGMGPITAIAPAPRVVTLGGASYLVGQVRLIDLAQLQAFLDAQTDDPLEGLDDILAEPDEDARQAKLLERYQDAQRGPLCMSDTVGAAFFRRTLEGRGLLLWVALRRYQPGLTVEDCTAIACRTEPAEFDRFYRLYHGANAVLSLGRLLLGDDADTGARRDVMTWPEAIDELSQLRGWTYETIYGLTINEWVAARTGGKPPKPGRRVRPGESLADAMKDWMKRFGRLARGGSGASAERDGKAGE